MKTFNTWYFKKSSGGPGKIKQHYDPFFYPLDVVGNWNRIYGKRGFYQLQCLLPAKGRLKTLRKILEMSARSRQVSFLTVLKQFGPKPSLGMLSFPGEGTTLCLDFPNRGEDTEKLLKALYREVDGAGGRIYPAKDALMTEKQFKKFYPRWKEFLQYKDPKCNSLFWKRVMGHP